MTPPSQICEGGSFMVPDYRRTFLMPRVKLEYRKRSFSALL